MHQRSQRLPHRWFPVHFPCRKGEVAGVSWPCVLWMCGVAEVMTMRCFSPGIIQTRSLWSPAVQLAIQGAPGLSRASKVVQRLLGVPRGRLEARLNGNGNKQTKHMEKVTKTQKAVHSVLLMVSRFDFSLRNMGSGYVPSKPL